MTQEWLSRDDCELRFLSLGRSFPDKEGGEDIAGRRESICLEEFGVARAQDG